MRGVHLNDALPQDFKAIRRSAQLADLIISVSEFTRQDIINYCGVPESKVKTILLGVDEAFKPLPGEEKIAKFKEKFGLNKPFFFSLGIVPRKNTERLLKAFANFRYRNDFQLVLAGYHGGQGIPSADSWFEKYVSIIKEKKLEDQVKFVGSLGEDELVLFYNTAYAFVFPSLCEGFGIPVLEAMACGLPVITSNISALPEVAGDAAILIDPYQEGAIRLAMEDLVDNEQLRRDLVQKGFENAKRFSWRKMAEEIRQEYNSLV